MEPTDLLQEVIDALRQGRGEETEQGLSEAYYDGYQETAEVAAYRDRMGIAPREANLYAKYIDAVLGSEEQRRTDWMMVADDPDSEEVAEAANELVNEMARVNDCNHFCSEAYKPMVIGGIGWLYFGRGHDAFGREYECEEVPASEIVRDPTSRRLDLLDCGFIARRRFLDKPRAKKLFPRHTKLIDATFSLHGDWGPVTGGAACYSGTHASLTREHASATWAEGSRPRVAVFDVYYRAQESRSVLHLQDGRRVEYDGENPEHADLMLNSMYVSVTDETVEVMRRAWYIGGVLVEDDMSPHPHPHFPYVMFRGYQEKRSGVCYGLGRRLRGPADSYNAANAQQHALMEKISVIVGRSAMSGPGAMTLDQIQEEAHRADGVFVIPDNARMELVHHYEQIQHLSQMKMDAIEEMRQASGVTQALTGEQQNAKSGIAIQTNIEQGATNLAELNANYQFARRMLGTLMLAHAMDRIGDRPTEVGIRNTMGSVAKIVKLNQPGEDGQLSNRFEHARLQVALADVQTSEGYRAQNMLTLQNVIPSSSELARPTLEMLMLESSNIPGREHAIDAIRKSIGRAETEEEQIEMDRAAAEAQAAEVDLLRREREAEIEKTLAEAALARAKAEEAAADTVRQGSEVGLKMAELTARQESEQQAANDAQMSEKRAALAKLRENVADRAVQALG